MKVSLNTIRQFLDFDLPATDILVEKIGAQLGEVDAVIDLGDKYKDALVVNVVECEKHPNADRLSVTKIDDGGVAADVPRDNNGLIQVVCGAPNVQSDMLAVWLPPKATVPASYDDKEPFVLDTRELRGILSQGMLAAVDELDLGSDHEGILEINPSELNCDASEVVPGASFAQLTDLDDIIVDIENKMFTHRPDCFGQLGVAREIAGILGHKFTSPSWYLDAPKFEAVSGLELEVFNNASDKVPRFMALAMTDVEVKSSPLWLQSELTRLGSKPINNVVDITNYIMLITAQPVHAYDYDKIRGHKLGARMAKKGEKVHLLNGKTYELGSDDIVIADSEGPIGLAGVMGGGGSEVDASTKTIVLEVATFDMYSVRRSSMSYGLFTDALTRFNKGQSPLQNDRVLARLASLMSEIVDAKPASQVFDKSAELSGPSRVATTASSINSLLGTELAVDEIASELNNVEFEIKATADELTVTAPFWRTDIDIAQDVVEEVGRLYGYDKLPLTLPSRSIKPASKNALLELKASLRAKLAKLGANEVLTYSFVHGKLLSKTGQDASHAYQVANALSPDLQYYRLSLAPSLLDKVHSNIKAGYDKLAIFELGKGHIKDQLDDDKLPREDQLLALVIAATDKARPKGAAYYQARKYLENLLGRELRFGPVPDLAKEFDITKPYNHERSAFVYHGDKFLGIIGEFTASTRKNLKLPNYCAGFELDIDALAEVMTDVDYQPLAKFPGTERDLTLQLDAKVSYAELNQLVTGQVSKSSFNISYQLINIYQATADNHKNWTFKFSINNPEETITAESANKFIESVVKSAAKQFSAKQV